MKRHSTFFLAVAMFLCAPLLLSSQETSTESASDAGSIEILETAICTDVMDREPQNVSEAVSASSDNVYCYTRIKNEGEPTTITHVWYFNGEKMAEVQLNVGTSSGWRTWSSKRLWKGWVGDWKVIIEDANGTPIEEIAFTTTDETGSHAQQ